MTDSNASSSPSYQRPPDYSNLKLMYQIRMEIAVDEKAARVNVGGLFRAMTRNVHRHDSTTVFFDVFEKEVQHEATLALENFVERFKVEQVSVGKMKKVAMGFFVKTNMTFATLKIAIGHQWLRDNKVYLREQALPFVYGTDLSLVGFYTMEHPWFGNVYSALEHITKAWVEATTVPVNDDDDQRLRQLERDGLITRGEGVKIPFTLERSKVTVKAPDTNKSTFSCDVWHLYVPRKHHSNAVFINDLAILDAQNLPHMIPQGLSKSNPTAFYQQMTKHSKFMHEHRNITINSISAENYRKLVTVETNGNKTHTSLWAILERTEMIYRHTMIPQNEIIYVSVNEKDYERALKWLDQTLKNMPIGAWVKQPTDAKASASRRSDRYSKAFATVSSDDGSFDPSTIASARTKHPWKRPPPMELVFDAPSEDQFPPLPTKAAPSYGQTVPSTTTPTTTLPDIEAILAKAMEEQELKFQQKLDQLSARNDALEASLHSLTENLNETINSIIDKTIAAMTGPTSPFFTKTDATELMEKQTQMQDHTQTQFEKILSLLSKTTVQGNSVTQSPPRKSQRTEEVGTPIICNNMRNDQIMTEARHEEVGTT